MSACVHASVAIAQGSAGDYVPPPAKLDDPEENNRRLEIWRHHIQQARELFKRLDVAGAERELQLAHEAALHFGHSSGPVATSLLNLAQLYRRSGQLEKAEPLLERAADVLDQTAGPNNKVTLIALLDLAATKLERGNTSGALEGFEDALTRLETAERHQAHGREALRDVRAACLLRVAKANVQLGMMDEAEARLRESLTLLEERWGRGSPKVLAPAVELASLLWKRGQRDEGEQLLARALALEGLRPVQREQLEKVAAELRAS